MDVGRCARLPDACTGLGTGEGRAPCCSQLLHKRTLVLALRQPHKHRPVQDVDVLPVNLHGFLNATARRAATSATWSWLDVCSFSTG